MRIPRSRHQRSNPKTYHRNRSPRNCSIEKQPLPTALVRPDDHSQPQGFQDSVQRFNRFSEKGRIQQSRPRRADVIEERHSFSSRLEYWLTTLLWIVTRSLGEVGPSRQPGTLPGKMSFSGLAAKGNPLFVRTCKQREQRTYKRKPAASRRTERASRFRYDLGARASA